MALIVLEFQHSKEESNDEGDSVGHPEADSPSFWTLGSLRTSSVDIDSFR